MTQKSHSRAPFRALFPTSLRTTRSAALLPLGAIAAGFGMSPAAFAQTVVAPPATAASAAAAAPAGQAGTSTTLPTIRAKVVAEPQGKDGVQAVTTRIGKGLQDLRDVPQSITVVTEKLIDDRNLDTMKDALRQTAGITFLAAEGGEEDIRLRGFALQSTGDVFVNGMRDPAFYERDTFFLDRLELIRGSASMLFGRGSTGGAVNQVTKVARLFGENQIDVTVGSHEYLRTVGDFNVKLGDSSAMRVGTMYTNANNNGSGTRLDKTGIATNVRWGIGYTDEIALTASHLENRNGMNYGLPFIRPTTTSPATDTTLLPVDPSAYYGMASDINFGTASTVMLEHIHRFGPGSEVVTKVQGGRYERDQRASTIRLAAAAAQPGGVAASLATFGPGTVLTRGTPLKIQDLNTVFAQSDYSGKFNLMGMRHEVQAGIDLAQEKKTVYAARSAAQGGVVPAKPSTRVGTPNDGASVNEDSRVLRVNNFYKSDGEGLYVQDLINFAPSWKLLLGLRYDHLVGNYTTVAIPNTAAGPETLTSYRMKVSEVSKRGGLIYQPTERMSFHFGAATSFNTSGDAYSLGANNVDTPPEQAINIEVGAKIDSADGNFTMRTAIFRSTKLHERNTDPLVNLVTLSGKRHAAGFELDLTGRITPKWEVFGSYAWIPVAKIDIGVAGSEGQGTRPSLTPVHSGTVWSTYQVTPAFRVGGGLNARGAQKPNRNPDFFVARFVTGDLMAEYQAVMDKLIFKLNVSNVTNKLYGDQLYTAHYIPGAGRMVQLTGSYKF